MSRIIDRDDIVNGVYFTRARSSRYALNPSSWAAFDESSRLHSDKEGAIELLTSAGWTADANGSFYKPGKKAAYFSIRILVNSDSPERVRIAETIAGSMDLIGLRASVDKCSPQSFATRISAGNYDMFIGETELLPNGDLTPLAVTGENSFGYSSAEVDALIAQQSIVTREADIKNVDRALCEKLYEDCPFAPICFMKKSMVTSAKLKSGVDPSVGGYVRDTVHWSI